MRKLTHPELLARQQTKSSDDQIPLTVVLNNIRSLYNVGSIFRTADGAGVEKIWLCGATGFPPQSGIAKTALGAEKRVPWDYSKDAASVIRRLKSEEYTIVLLEQLENSIGYHQLEIHGPVCLVLGNEITGVDDDLVELCDVAVEIEMAGLKNSLNVAVAFGVVAYHYRYLMRTK